MASPGRLMGAGRFQHMSPDVRGGRRSSSFTSKSLQVIERAKAAPASMIVEEAPGDDSDRVPEDAPQGLQPMKPQQISTVSMNR